jgi:hypothetical protein
MELMAKLIIFIFFTFSIFADDFGGLGHPNKGCPFNSICGKEMGIKKAAWDDLLKNLPKDKTSAVLKMEKFRKKNGLLIPIWMISNFQEENDLIKWSSPCPQHHKDENKFFQAEVFVSDFNQLDNKRFIEEVALLLNEDNSIITYKIPNKEIPLHLYGQEMIFSMTSEGVYYYLGVNPSGKIRTLDIKPLDFGPSDIDCPVILTNSFNQLPKGLYSGHFCKNIYNSIKKKYQTLLFGLTCV